jgi:adenylate kinase family enzyme
MHEMRRILVIGSGGAGKTTAARSIAAAAGLPLVHLDRVYWHAGWQPTPVEQWTRMVDDLIAGEEWVIDGNYGGTLPSRLARADAVVFLDVPRVTCLWRVIKRAARHRTRSREDIAPGCPDRVTWEFARWIWSYPKKRKAGVLELLDEFERSGGRAIVLHDAGEVEAFVSSLASGEHAGRSEEASLRKGGEG